MSLKGLLCLSLVGVACCVTTLGAQSTNVGGLTSFADVAGGGQHVFYLDTSKAVNQLFFNGTEWINQNLTAITGSPRSSADRALSSFVDAAGGQHVFYFDSRNVVNQLFFDGTKWINQSLSNASGVPIARSPSELTSFVDATGGQHVFYFDTKNVVSQLFFDGTKWIIQNLSNASGVPIAGPASRLTSFADAAGGQHVFYIDPRNTVNQLFFDGTKWIVQNLSSDSGVPITGTASGLTGFSDATGGQHVFYFDPNNGVNQLFFNGTKWIKQGLRSAPGVPSGSSSGGSGGSPGPNQPSLIATYCFNNSIGTEPFNLTVTFAGVGPGAATFRQQIIKEFRPPTPKECLEARFSNLSSGAWTVTATPNGIGAPLECSVKVPGTIVLDVSGGSPACR